MPYGFNTQNESGDTVCWSCRGDAYACECPEERREDESVDDFRLRCQVSRELAYYDFED